MVKEMKNIYSGCTAVSEARVILETVTHYDFDDEQICGSEYNYRVIKPKEVSINSVKSKLNIYPNPTDNTLNISYSDLSNNSTVTVVDMLGKVRLVQPVLSNSGTLTFDTKLLPNGIYELTITENGLNKINQRISIIHE